MNEKMRDRRIRCKLIGAYIAKTGCTVRQAAKEFSISKSIVHEDVTKVLPKEDEYIAAKVATVLMKNKTERSIRGGMATKAKYAKMKEENS